MHLLSRPGRSYSSRGIGIWSNLRSMSIYDGVNPKLLGNLLHDVQTEAAGLPDFQFGKTSKSICFGCL